MWELLQYGVSNYLWTIDTLTLDNSLQDVLLKSLQSATNLDFSKLEENVVVSKEEQ